MMKQKFFWLTPLLQIIFALCSYGQGTEKCGTFSSEVLEKIGLGCEERPTYTTEEFTFQSKAVTVAP